MRGCVMFLYAQLIMELHYIHSITLTLDTNLFTPPLTSMFLSRQDKFLVLKQPGFVDCL